jgi:hypothetical protein
MDKDKLSVDVRVLPQEFDMARQGIGSRQNPPSFLNVMDKANEL